MNLGYLLNGAGALTALSAAPMIVGLLLVEGLLARWLRRIALILALVLPIIFMVLAALLYLPKGGKVFFDFAVNDDAARLLYGANGDPYSVHAAYSFPFPTFYLYWLASAFGNLSQQAAWVVWWLVGGATWLVCVALLWRMLPRSVSPRSRDMLRYVAVAIPAITVLWQGQTALFVLAGLIATHFGLLPQARRTSWIIAGLGLALAILIKPQLALVGLGIALWTFFAFRERRDFARQVIFVLVTAAITALILIGLTLILPAGVTLETYRNFVTEALPQVARPGDNINVIGSPAFVGGLLALRIGASESIANLIANLITVLVLALAIIWTIRLTHRPLTEIAAGWAVWAMVAPRVSWTWYAAWCLPFFALAVLDIPFPSLRGEGVGVRGIDHRHNLHLALFVIVLALLNLQIAVTLVEFLTILLLMFLLWTSFRATEHV